MNNPYQAYRSNSVMTASPAELTLMLYNGAIRFCNQGIEALEKNDLQSSHKYILKVQDIIIELQATLDMKYQVAESIDALYIFIKQLLIEANIEKDKTKLLQAKELIVEFRDLWQEVMKKTK